ncbi:GRAS family protein [Archangium sp.]|uniref:GRAS family protein n=1 Tax=Archangium sp. TaxID=1872627 RepID=UPI002D59C9FC|nr:GRAS family protein [Archangium sp.]HYO52398.1 GRAS family protein [Archangium sp.]
MRSEKFSLLTRALEELQMGQAAAARRSLAALTRLLDVDAIAEDMKYFLFATALARRVGVGEAQQMNLYLRRFELPQISLFNLVAERLPMVGLAGHISNDLMCGLIADHEEATLIDVGLGTGRQEVALLRKLKASGAALRRLTVVGVEPDRDSLRQAEAALSDTARELGIALRFRGLPKVIEALDEDDWGMLQDNPGPRVVHAAFALHHMAAGVDRQDIFHRMRAVVPAAVVLVEPNSDHATDSLSQRFHNAWHHFSHNFELVDELGLPPRERNGIKLFFGRELEDILGAVDDSLRYERHERVETWRERLRAAGFSPVPAGRLAGSWSFEHPTVHIRQGPGYVGVGYKEETLVTVLCATAEVGC